MAVGDNGGRFETVITAKDEGSRVVRDFGEHTKKALADTSEHVRGQAGALAKASEEMGASTSRIGERVAQVAKAVAAAAAGAAVAGVAMLRNAIDRADKLAEVSTKLGVSAEALSAWEYKAKQAGVNAQQLEASLTAMSKAISKADFSDKSNAAKALDQLGLETAELKKLGPDKAVLAIADALDAVPDKFDRVRIATDIFGKSGAGMVGVLEGGSKAFRETYEEAEKFGQVIDTKTAKAADAFNDNVERLKGALGGVSNQVAAPLLGPLATLSEKFVLVAKDTGAFKSIADALVGVLKGLAGGLVVIGGIVGVTAKAVGGTAAALAALIARDFAGAKQIMKEMASDIGDITKKTKDLLNEFFKPVAFVPEQSTAGLLRKVALSPSFGGQSARNAARAAGEPEPSGVYSDVAPGAELRSRDSRVQAFANTARSQVELQLHNIAQLLKSEEDLVEESYRKRLAVIDNAEALQLETETSYDELRRQLKTEREFELSRIHENSARSRYAVTQLYNSLSLSAGQFFFSQLGALMQTKSRALFEIGKAGAIAETIINTYRAAQGAYAALAGIPVVGPALGAAAAAAAIAVGFARVAALRSTSYCGATGSPVLSSGGVSGPVTSSGTGVAVPVAPAPVQGTPAERGRVINVFLSGEGSPTQSYIRDVLVPGLNEALGDGATLNVRTV